MRPLRPSPDVDDHAGERQPGPETVGLHGEPSWKGPTMKRVPEYRARRLGERVNTQRDSGTPEGVLSLWHSVERRCLVVDGQLQPSKAGRCDDYA